MTTRDDVEIEIRRWHQYEIDRGNEGIIDYDCDPDHPPVSAARSRYEVLDRLSALRRSSGEHVDLVASIDAHIWYLRARLGERIDLAEYIARTQGCGSTGWPDSHLDDVHRRAVEHLERLGVSWNEKTESALEAVEGRLEAGDAGGAIESAAAQLEPHVRQLCGTDAPFSVAIETVEVDQYWSYWLDGQGSTARLRLNLRRAQFTAVRARQFALHEVLGHALQSASYAARCANVDVPWLRVLAVHAPHQVLLEGLAQALPLFMAQDDEQLLARVRLDHFHMLVCAELHHLINAGSSVEECVRFARGRVPYWSDERIGDLLSDRSTDPRLRSYLWSYPAGIDWFAALADHGSRVVAEEVLRAAYREPLTPRQLGELWPAGPAVGGPGRRPVRVRQPSIS